jgi:hypothetical protein
MRCTKNTLKILVMAALSATVAVLQPHSAEAGAYYYSGMPRTFNVGMLVTDSESLGVSVTDVHMSFTC